MELFENRNEIPVQANWMLVLNHMIHFAKGRMAIAHSKTHRGREIPAGYVRSQELSEAWVVGPSFTEGSFDTHSF